MNESSVKVGPVRVVFSPSSPILKILVVVLVVFSTVALAALSWVSTTILGQTQEMGASAAAVSARNQVLEQRMADMENEDTVRAIAKEELGLVDPKTTLIETK